MPSCSPPGVTFGQRVKHLNGGSAAAWLERESVAGGACLGSKVGSQQGHERGVRGTESQKN